MKWYFRDSALIIAFLMVGPFMLPLVWYNPRYNIKSKILWTVVILILTLALVKPMLATIDYLKENLKLLESLTVQ